MLFSVRRVDTCYVGIKLILIIDHAGHWFSDGWDFGFDFENFRWLVFSGTADLTDTPSRGLDFLDT